MRPMRRNSILHVVLILGASLVSLAVQAALILGESATHVTIEIGPEVEVAAPAGSRPTVSTRVTCLSL